MNARATLSFLDEWAKSLDYSNEKAKYADLTWGEVALETGFIHNLRFFGNYQIGVEKGKRIYANDKSSDPLFAIIRELFPSTGGVLSAAVGGGELKLCNELSCTDIGTIIKFGYLSLYQGKPNIKKLDAFLNQIEKEQKGTDAKSLKFYLDDLKRFSNNIKKILNAANQNNDDLAKHKKEVLAQVLLAFLYEKINLQGTEIKDDTKIYKEETVKGLKAAFGEEMFLASETQVTQQDEASETTRKYFKDLWGNNPYLPYIAAPIQNGLANVIAIKDGQPEATSHTFPDCVEVAIRHFFNVILYKGWEDGGFKYQDQPIVETKKDLFKEFYDNQPTRDLANNGSDKLRTQWNKVMSHIPEVIYKIKENGNHVEENRKPVKENGSLFEPYKEGSDLASNEIKAGIISLYNVLAYLLQGNQIKTGEKGVANDDTRYGLITKFYASQGDPEDEEKLRSELSENLADKFNALLEPFGCTASIDFHSSGNGEKEPDLYGDVEIAKSGNKLLTLEMQNGHGLLTLNLKTPKQATIKEEIIPNNPMLLLLPTGNKLTEYQTRYPYYASFHSDLTFSKNGNFTKDKIDGFTFSPAEDEIKYIRSFVAQTEGNKWIGQSVKDYFTSNLYNKLEIEENDEDANRKYVKEIGICNEHSQNTVLLENLYKFENLKTLRINGLLYEIGIKDLSIENCKNLETIEIVGAKQLQNLTIKDCPKFKGFSKSSLSNLPKLETISIENCENFEQLDVEKFKKLRTITIKNCPNFDKSNKKKVNSNLVELITE